MSNTTNPDPNTAQTDPDRAFLEIKILDDIRSEVDRQVDTWGVQHWPSTPTWQPVTEKSTPTSQTLPILIAGFYGIPSADLARTYCEEATAANDVTWPHILIEELCEAVEAAALSQTTDTTNLRAELIQCAAVIVSWVRDIDSTQAPDA